MHSLLAVDVGLKTGTALYGKNGKLRWYRSKNYGSAPNLKRGANALLNEIPDLSYLVLEGGGQLADIGNVRLTGWQFLSFGSAPNSGVESYCIHVNR